MKLSELFGRAELAYPPEMGDIEIENGYTQEAKDKVKNLIINSKRDIIVNVNKEGTLNYGDKVIIEVSIYYNRRLPFNPTGNLVKYSILGEYYNINGY